MNRARPTLCQAVLFAAFAGSLLGTGSASAQYDFPRIGLSAAPDHYVDAMEAEIGEEFTMYACVFANTPGEPLQQPLQSVAWVIHQACCGAYLDLLDVVYNPEFEHVGQSLGPGQ